MLKILLIIGWGEVIRLVLARWHKEVGHKLQMLELAACVVDGKGL